MRAAVDDISREVSRGPATWLKRASDGLGEIATKSSEPVLRLVSKTRRMTTRRSWTWGPRRSSLSSLFSGSSSQVSTQASTPAKVDSECSTPTQNQNKVNPARVALVSWLKDGVLGSDCAETRKKLVRVIDALLHAQVDDTEIAEMLIHAQAYMEEYKPVLAPLRDSERMYTTLLLLVMAHWHVSDDPCSLGDWHATIFADYCELEKLEVALVGLLKLRQFRLRVDDDILDRIRATVPDNGLTLCVPDGPLLQEV
mmetsp:Transcript_134592/g.304884  ORF Transcript_134592/g.304884 Transcript_134592/m.304884 type:complete len:255 (+) Transcript_134592:34-798(+)